MSDFTPTDQQVQAVELFLDGGNLKVQALAGAGKTSTLKLMANATDARGRYISFNKAIATEAAAAFPDNVACSTAHSLAMRAVGRKYAHRLNSNRMKPWDVASALDVDFPWAFDLDDGGTKELEPSRVASIVSATVASFCMSADREIGREHVPWQRGLDEPGKRVNNVALQDRVVRLARTMWKDLADPNGRFPFQHNHYLKLWALDGPVIDADFILFDEAQDANPLMLGIVEEQRHAQKIYVGDSNQQIYAWNGAVNAMELAQADNEAWLTESFRFGPEIAEAANLVLDRLDAPQMVVGSGAAGFVGHIDSPDVVLSRTNASVMGTALYEMARGRRVHVVGGVKDLVYFAEHAEKLQSGRKASHPDLACFDSWGEVQGYVESEDGADLRMIVGLIDDFGARRLIGELRNTVDEAYADVVLSTAHKSKGREWPLVRLEPDFPTGEDVGEEELRLLYVAATRAQTGLDVSLVSLSGVPEFHPASPAPAVPAAGEPWEDNPTESAERHPSSGPHVPSARDFEVDALRATQPAESVVCPYCSAPAGEQCRTLTTGRPTIAHVGRLEHAKEAVERDVEVVLAAQVDEALKKLFPPA